MDKPIEDTDIIGYRFEILPLSEYDNTTGCWQKAEIRDFEVADGVTYLIVQLRPDTTYMIRVASRNAAGLSDFTEPKEFQTHALVPRYSSSSSLQHSKFMVFLFLVISLLQVRRSKF